MREFTDFEKQLIRRINSGQGNNLPNLIDPFINTVSISVDTASNVSTIIFETAHPHQINNIVERIAQIEAIIIQSVNLIKLLEDIGYIFTYTSANQIQNPFIYGRAASNLPFIPYTFPDKRISELLTQYSVQDIFVTPELKVFIDNKFLPREEIRFRKQFLMTSIAIIVAIIGVFTNLFFNIKKEYFSDGQKFDSVQFQILLNHLDNNNHSNILKKGQLIINKNITRDTTLLETIVETEVKVNSTPVKKSNQK